ncbi:glycosyltransferase family 2 protein [Vagococcus silagei]
MKKNKLTIIIPCYNEEEVLPISSQSIKEVLFELIDQKKISNQSCILFVDDGSTDSTWKLIESLNLEDPVHFTGIKFSRNFGHQNALIAGLTVATKNSDMLITIDADLQDDIQAIKQMVIEYYNGFDVVYGVRNNRDMDTFFKRKTANYFYTIMEKIGVKMVPNHADFRLMSQRATKTLLSFKEQNIFLRGLVPLVGYPSTEVYYSRNKRFAGDSKYPLKKMLAFALEGITSFSIMPIRLVRNLGIFTFLIGIIYTLNILFQHFSGNTVTGWASLTMSICILGGIQLVSLSIIGEYIGKIYSEVKHRPRFIIEKNLDNFTEEKYFEKNSTHED